MEALFVSFKDMVINWESVTKPRYSIDLAGTNIETLHCQEELQ